MIVMLMMMMMMTMRERERERERERRIHSGDDHHTSSGHPALLTMGECLT